MTETDNFLFKKDINIKLTYEDVESEDKQKIRVEFTFLHPKEDDQFNIMSKIDNIDKYEKLAKKENIEAEDIDGDVMQSTLEMRATIINSMAKNLKSATGYSNAHKDAQEYFGNLQSFILNDLISEFIKKSTEGMTSKKYHLLASDGGMGRS